MPNLNFVNGISYTPGIVAKASYLGRWSLVCETFMHQCIKGRWNSVNIAEAFFYESCTLQLGVVLNTIAIFWTITRILLKETTV
jgi:hypothetical protein